MSDYKKKICRYCDAPLGEPYLELGSMPLANNLPRKEDLKDKEFECPLSLVFCEKCGLVQLSHVVPPELMFSHYLYVSSTTKTFQDHFASYARDVRKRVNGQNPLAVDLGSNDGLLLECYKREGMRICGVDPAKNLADEANQKGLTTLNHFFNSDSVEEILKNFGPASVVSGNNVFAHIDDIQSVLKNVHKLLTPDGIFVIEFPYLGTMLDELLFDMTYHEHLSYIGVTALRYVVERFGFVIFDVEAVPSHGGSLRVFMQKRNGGHQVKPVVEHFLEHEQKEKHLDIETHRHFAKKVLKVKADFMATIKKLKAEGKIISGYGAPAKASTLCNFYGLTTKHLDYVVDDNPLKQNRFIPGMHIPIVPSPHLNAKPTDVVVIFAWNFAAEIIKKIIHLEAKGTTFLVPLFNPKKTLTKTNPFLISSSTVRS